MQSLGPRPAAHRAPVATPAAPTRTPLSNFSSPGRTFPSLAFALVSQGVFIYVNGASIERATHALHADRQSPFPADHTISTTPACVLRFFFGSAELGARRAPSRPATLGPEAHQMQRRSSNVAFVVGGVVGLAGAVFGGGVALAWARCVNRCPQERKGREPQGGRCLTDSVVLYDFLNDHFRLRGLIWVRKGRICDRASLRHQKQEGAANIQRPIPVPRHWGQKRPTGH